MGQEIERKFLVTGDAWRAEAEAVRFRQGYLSTHPDRNVRVRVAGERSRITVKGRAEGITRLEYEYDIPKGDADELLDHLCQRPLIEKTRHSLEHAGHEWVIDEFSGANEGLVVAEIELDSEDEPFEKPPWVGEEVTHDPRYLNANLVEKPYTRW